MRFRCNLCSEVPRMFEWEDNSGACPKCGASGPPLVAALVDVHLMVMSRKGPIMGRMGRQYVCCQPERAYLNRHPAEQFFATDDLRAVTCPKCLRSREFAEMAPLYEDLERAVEAPAITTVDMGEARSRDKAAGGSPPQPVEPAAAPESKG